jgi:hypothetical protein
MIGRSHDVGKWVMWVKFIWLTAHITLYFLL